MTSKPQANKTIKSILTEYRIGFVVGDKDVDQHFKEFEQAITQAMLDAVGSNDTGMLRQPISPFQTDELEHERWKVAMIRDQLRAEIRTAIKKMTK